MLTHTQRSINLQFFFNRNLSMFHQQMNYLGSTSKVCLPYVKMCNFLFTILHKKTTLKPYIVKVYFPSLNTLKQKTQLLVNPNIFSLVVQSGLGGDMAWFDIVLPPIHNKFCSFKLTPVQNFDIYFGLEGVEKFDH